MSGQASAALPRQFLQVTERGGELVSAAQLERFYQRYVWAGGFCGGKDVLEMACGTGPGLGHLLRVSRSLIAGDLDPVVLGHAREHYGSRVDLRQFDAMSAPFEDGSFDVVILFEAIYYVPDLETLAREVARLLRPGGVFLIATANKDLFDFNPSPFAQRYLNPPELAEWLGRHGFTTQFSAGSPAPIDGGKAKLLRAAKRIAVRLHLIPGSMSGKRLIKRFVFGRLVKMPEELDGRDVRCTPPVAIPADQPDRRHLVLYCAATKS